MEPPSNIETRCPVCEDMTLHQVLNGRLSGGKGNSIVLDATVKCGDCGRVHHVTMRDGRSVEVPLIISEGSESETTSIDLPSDQMVRVKDEYKVMDVLVQVTSIEKGDRRVRSAPAGEIDAIWSKRFDRLPVKVSIYRGRRTIPETVISGPDEIFSVGEVIDVKGRPAVIETIKIPQRILRKGEAEARDIVRVYARLMTGPS